jgi:DDB1- and CUL4-associated factor 7
VRVRPIIARHSCNQIVELDDDKGDFVVKGSFDHPYPTTNIIWAPAGNTLGKDLLATTGDYLRLWNVQDDGEIRLECLLNNVRLLPSLLTI